MHQKRMAPSGVSATSSLDSVQFIPAPLAPKDGLLVVNGYGVRITVERGHLAVIDGAGNERRSTLFNRATARIRRLVILGHSGLVSLEAMKWLSDIGASFIQIDRDGEIVTCSAPLGLDDARLRRSQAIATTNGVGLELARELIAEKISRQREVIARFDPSDATIEAFERSTLDLSSAQSIVAVRLAEAQAASTYWASWKAIDIPFAKRDEPRVPQHWRRFDARASPIANGPRMAVSPVNALLNYLYAILESEARIACLAVGLDPGMGVLHADLKARDSMALDLMEPVRPQIDELVLDLLKRQIFTAKDFFETELGNCRLMPSLTKPLTEYGRHIAKWVAPYAEAAARSFGNGSTTVATVGHKQPTPLTQTNRREGRASVRVSERKASTETIVALPKVCKGCGVTIEQSTRLWCDSCLPEALSDSAANYLNSALRVKADLTRQGMDPAQSAEAKAKRRATRVHQMKLEQEWEAQNESHITVSEYRETILPLIAQLSTRVLSELMGVSLGYASSVKKGGKVPHPRHWSTLSDSVSKDCP